VNTHGSFAWANLVRVEPAEALLARLTLDKGVSGQRGRTSVTKGGSGSPNPYVLPYAY